MADTYQILLGPIVTEKSSLLRADSVYVFKVLKGATKSQIKEAIQTSFGVDVESINTLPVRGKKRSMGKHIGSTSSWKKAYVKVKAGQKIKQLEVSA